MHAYAGKADNGDAVAGFPRAHLADEPPFTRHHLQVHHRKVERTPAAAASSSNANARGPSELAVQSRRCSRSCRASTSQWTAFSVTTRTRSSANP
jgi:hypothetical protein